jgi:hypothetical protein
LSQRRARVYILKRVDVDDNKTYVFTDKTTMRKHINRLGGVFMEKVLVFRSRDDVIEFIEKCRERDDIIVLI